MQREREVLEHAVHAVTEQVAKAGLPGCSDVRIAIRVEAVHEANPTVSRATLVAPAHMYHRDRMRASRALIFFAVVRSMMSDEQLGGYFPFGAGLPGAVSFCQRWPAPHGEPAV